ncbi:MAG: type II toxin-antitoxin system CcdA family antitoxin [Solirubrobacteraceae bacterium]
MARLNVYLPDELAREARTAELNISQLTQQAVGSALARGKTDRWLDSLERLPAVTVSHESVLAAIDQGRNELGERAER